MQYCQRQKCSPVNVVSSNIRVMQIFAGIGRYGASIKQESGRLRCRFSYLSLAIFSESSSPRLKSATHSICVKLLHKHDKLTEWCRAFTLALARLSCFTGRMPFLPPNQQRQSTEGQYYVSVGKDNEKPFKLEGRSTILVFGTKTLFTYMQFQFL